MSADGRGKSGVRSPKSGVRTVDSGLRTSDPGLPCRLRLRPWAFALAATLLITIHYGWALPRHLTEPGWVVWRRDFWVYHQATQAAWHGRTLYVQTLPRDRPQPLVWRPGGYFYPPAF